MIRLFFLVVFTLISYPVAGNEIDQSDLSYKDGVFLSKSTGDPLTGVVKQRYDNGQMKSERHFQNGIQHGLNRSWYENGQLKYETNRISGCLDGDVTSWWDNGALKLEATFDDGKQVGISRMWNDEGKLLHESDGSKDTRLSCDRPDVKAAAEQDSNKHKAKRTRKPKVYTGRNKVLRMPFPEPRNFAGVRYKAKRMDNRGDDHYDKVMFYVDDFGQYLVCGARYLPDKALIQMDRDDPQTQLRKISEASLFSWRGDLTETPEVVEETFFNSTHGPAMRRVYLVKNGSLLLRWQLGKDSKGPLQFDTHIVSLVARQGNVLVYALAEDDESPDDPDSLATDATRSFNAITVLPLDD
jgi:hypothetical protein